MADRVTGRISSSASIIRYAETGRPAPLTIPITMRADDSFGESGTGGYDAGLDDASEVYEDVLNLAASTPQTLDLSALVDPDGRAVSFTRVRYVRFVNRSTTGAVGIAPDLTNGWAAGPTATLAASTERCEGRLEQVIPDATGGAVTGGSKRITFDPGAAPKEVDVLIVGLKA